MGRASFQCVCNPDQVSYPLSLHFPICKMGQTGSLLSWGQCKSLGMCAGKMPQVCSVGLRTLRLAPSSQRNQTLVENSTVGVTAWLGSGARIFAQATHSREGADLAPCLLCELRCTLPLQGFGALPCKRPQCLGSYCQKDTQGCHLVHPSMRRLLPPQRI